MRLPLTTRNVLAVGAAALFLVVAPARPAWAHAQLLKTDPAAGATVDTPLDRVTLTFNEMVKQQFSTVVVTAADGVSYSTGTPRSVDRTLTQAVRPLPAGAVRVAWRTVSADGHPIEGQFTFTNAAASAPPPQQSTAPPSTARPAATGPETGAQDWIWPAAGGAAVVAAGLGVLIRRRARAS